MTADNRRDGGLGAQALLACILFVCLMTGCLKQEAEPDSRTAEDPAVAEQEVQPPPSHIQQDVKLPSDIAAEILGRWKIVRHDSCGINAMSEEEADWHTGKTILIEPGRMVFDEYPKDNVSETIACHFTEVRVGQEDAEELLVAATGCSPNDNGFVKIKEKKVKIFFPEGEGNTCGDTPFPGLFKPNYNTMVIQWNRILFFMEREANGAGRADRAGSAKPSVPESGT